MINDMFDYRPLNLGVVFDIGEEKVLQRVKNQLIEFTRSLEADTEDLVYVHSAERRKFDTYLGESIAAIANWKRSNLWLDWGDGLMPSKDNPTSCMTQTLQLLLGNSSENRRHLMLITDGFTKTVSASAQNACRRIEKDSFPYVKFSVIAIGNAPEVGQVGVFSFARSYRCPTILDFTKEIIGELTCG